MHFIPFWLSTCHIYILTNTFSPNPNFKQSLRKKKALENTVGKGENAGEQQLLFLQCFPYYQVQVPSVEPF